MFFSAIAYNLCFVAGAEMFSLIKNLGVQIALKREAVPFVIALLIASSFQIQKFGARVSPRARRPMIDRPSQRIR